LGFRLVETDLCTAGKCHFIDARVAAALIMRRDITTQPYEEKLREGAICTIRYGLGRLGVCFSSLIKLYKKGA